MPWLSTGAATFETESDLSGDCLRVPDSGKSEAAQVRNQWLITRNGLKKVTLNMGAFLDKPNTDKWNTSGEGQGVRYAVATMQGWRVDMEDAHVVQIGLDNHGPFAKWSFFAVFDGHAGTKVAQHSADNLLKSVLSTDQFKQMVEELTATNGEINSRIEALLEAGVKTGFLTLDAQMRDRSDAHGDDRSGTTAICALITSSHIFLANLGDSRAVLSKKGQAAFGTQDHKPFLPKERDRIVNAGGSVMIQRVNGSLAVSRALGDFEYKAVPGLQANEQLVSPEPDVYILRREPDEDEFLLLACDGVYDVMSNCELCDFVRSRMRVTPELSTVANHVLDACLSKGSRDNMSVVLVAFPAAPGLDQQAQVDDAIWKDAVEKKVNEMFEDERASENGEIDVDVVMRMLQQQNLPHLPPGAGIHAARAIVDAILERRGKTRASHA